MSKNKKTKLNFPVDFFDYSNGVDVSEKKVQEWVDKISGPVQVRTDYIKSGDTIVIKIDDEIIVAKNYSMATIN